jgi:hypothetical protein
MSEPPPETARNRREIGGSLGAEQREALETITGRGDVSILVGEVRRVGQGRGAFRGDERMGKGLHQRK